MLKFTINSTTLITLLKTKRDYFERIFCVADCFWTLEGFQHKSICYETN